VQVGASKGVCVCMCVRAHMCVHVCAYVHVVIPHPSTQLLPTCVPPLFLLRAPLAAGAFAPAGLLCFSSPPGARFIPLLGPASSFPPALPGLPLPPFPAPFRSTCCLRVGMCVCVCPCVCVHVSVCVRAALHRAQPHLCHACRSHAQL